MVDKELRKLRREIEEEKKEIRRLQLRARTTKEKTQLKRELFLLKNPTARTAVDIGKRFARGGKIVSKKVGGFLVKQGKLIAEQQERERRIEENFAKRPKIITKKKTKFKVKKIKRTPLKKRTIKKRSLETFDPLGSLDF